ncbi:prophage tail fiber N-terminal domain-containing protein [Escherichia coli]|nr:prophage tail fiber N-terminal domain-containing protein [Escherichia coli]
MTVKISGVLKDGTGKPVQNCTIVLKARRTSSTVVVNTVASENPDEAGRYSMDVEHGQYSVTLLVEGFPPSHAGTITVYEGSRPGTLNDFLGAMTEDDVRPEALRRFEQMVEEVSRNASAVAQNTAAAKKSASDASASASEAATHATDAAASARAASTSAGQAASSAQSASSSAGTASTKAREAAKVLLLQSHQKARQLPAPVPRKRQKRMPQRHNNQQPLLHPPRPRKRQKQPLQHGMRRLQKRRQNHQKRTQPRAPAAQLPRQRRQQILRRRQKRPRRTPGLLKRQRDRAPQLRQTQNSGCIICQCRVNKCRAGLSQCHRRRKIGRKCCIVCFNSHNEGWRSRCTGQRSSEVCFRSEDIQDERESVGNQRRILKNGCRIVRQFGGVIGIICVCFKR